MAKHFKQEVEELWRVEYSEKMGLYHICDPNEKLVGGDWAPLGLLPGEHAERFIEQCGYDRPLHEICYEFYKYSMMIKEIMEMIRLARLNPN